jgi:hypothetical protein
MIGIGHGRKASLWICRIEVALEHRAKKWEPVFCISDAKPEGMHRAKVGTGFLQKAGREKRAPC